MREYLVVDVFTDVPLEGNPVAVFSDGSGLSSEVMQRAARELNLSETVFLLPAAGNGEHARARIFTPTAELPFAGHPVLGTAFILGRRLDIEAVSLLTGAGLIAIALQREHGTIVFGEMEQPVPTWEPLEGVEELLGALGVQRSLLPVEVYTNGPRHAFVELESRAPRHPPGCRDRAPVPSAGGGGGQRRARRAGGRGGRRGGRRAG